ncbi:MAG: SDR family NAD(P)-dependent oxidoreductase [Candidatus Methylomirabilales bacterium]
MSTHRVAVVTGSSRGIGRAIALRLARDGYTIIVNYRNTEDAAAAALEEIQSLVPASIAVKADVSKPEGAETVIGTAIETFGGLDILVNNVGPFLVKPLVDTKDDEWREMLDGNLGSAFYCIRAALPQMRGRRRGNIINVGALNTDALQVGVFEAPAYYAAKAGLMMLTRRLAHSEAPFNIRVNAVNPGFIETEEYAAYTEADKARWVEMIPTGTFGRPDDVAGAVSFLVSDNARYITGAVLHVHGGLFA